MSLFKGLSIEKTPVPILHNFLLETHLAILFFLPLNAALGTPVTKFFLVIKYG